MVRCARSDAMRNEVSTGSGSDRVLSSWAGCVAALFDTRSLPLPVLTSPAQPSPGHIGNRKRERHPRPFVWFGPQAPMMVLDDRATNGQADAHAVSFGRVEGLK